MLKIYLCCFNNSVYCKITIILNLQFSVTYYLDVDLVRFFGALFSALYKVKEKENELKHFVVYKEAADYVSIYPQIMEDVFNLSLEITSNTTVTRNVEQRVLEYSVQVSIHLIDLLRISLKILY